MKRSRGRPKGGVTKSKSVSIQKRTNDVASKLDYFTSNEISSIMSLLTKQINNMLVEDVVKGNGQKFLEAYRDRLMFVLGLELGARVNELVRENGLTWEQIEIDAPIKVIRIRDQKKDCERICTIPEYAWDMITNYREVLSNVKDMRKEKFLFPFVDKTANRRIKDWAKAVGITRRVRWHMLRHTMVIQSKRNGRDWDWICQQTGDSIEVLIRVYGRLSIEDRHMIGNEHPLITQETGG